LVFLWTVDSYFAVHDHSNESVRFDVFELHHFVAAPGEFSPSTWLIRILFYGLVVAPRNSDRRHAELISARALNWRCLPIDKNLLFAHQLGGNGLENSFVNYSRHNLRLTRLLRTPHLDASPYQRCKLDRIVNGRGQLRAWRDRFATKPYCGNDASRNQQSSSIPIVPHTRIIGEEKAKYQVANGPQAKGLVLRRV
jgi:hypothetical protein